MSRNADGQLGAVVFVALTIFAVLYWFCGG